MPKKSKSPSRPQYHAPTLTAHERAAEQNSLRKSNTAERPDPWSGESRGAVFLTVGWMFSMLATLLSLFIWLGVWWSIGRGTELPNAPLILLYATVFALATGLLTLVLGVVVNRIRNRPAPPSIRRVAGIVGALPWAIYATMFLFSK